MKRAQASVSAMIAISIIFLVLFLIQFFLFMPNQSRTMNAATVFSAETICEKLQYSIDSAIAGGPGFSSSITLPERLNGRLYNITVYPSNHIYLSWRNEGNYMCQFYADDIILKANESWVQTKVGYLQKENCLTEELQKFNTTIYCNDKTSIDCPEISTPCTDLLYKATWSMDRFFQEAEQYDVLFMEDPHITSEDTFQIIEDLVYNGSALFMSEHVEVSNPFDKIYEKNCGGGTAIIVAEDNLSAFNIGDEITLHETPCILTDLKKIATYTDTGNPAISKINYGNGFVFYYSDFDCEVNGDPILFKEQVVENLNLTAKYMATYKNPTFQVDSRTVSVYNDEDAIIIDQTTGGAS